jgi:hypothetical protein
MMERLTSDAEAYRACLASMLQMDLEEFPTFEGLAAPLQWNAWLSSASARGRCTTRTRSLSRRASTRA